MNPSIEKLRKHYLPFLSAEKEYAKLDWEDAYSHLKRFEVFISSVSLEGKSLLDVGCGIGSLFRFLKSQNISCLYTGIDALPEMISLAKKLSPEAHFLIGDPFLEEKFPPASFDIVFASGIFNLNLDQDEKFFYEAIKKMHTWSSEAMVFNALHCRSHCQNNTYRYYNPHEIMCFLKNTYPDTICLLYDDYLINDFTVVVKRLYPHSQ